MTTCRPVPAGAEPDAALAACDRFVPPRLRELLGAGSIAQLHRGQHVERELHILFTDIQGYTALSEGESAAAMFQFISDFMSAMEPALERNGGVIANFAGDAIMALFADDAGHAVAGAQQLGAALHAFNQQRAVRGLLPIRVGIGVHSGMASVGVVGTSQRLELTVIGDSVNLAARLESATRTYGAQILVSEGLVYSMPDALPASRFVDRIRVKGKLRPVSIYEVFSPDNDPDCAAKTASRREFERGVAWYMMGHVQQARAIFTTLCEQCPQDSCAQVYLRRCDEFLRTGRHEGTGEISTGVEWDRAYEIGVGEIDEQHREWCARVNALFQQLQSGDHGQLPAVFDYLRSYIDWHFSKEEEIMQARAYPLRAEHEREHRRYAQVLDRFRTELAQASDVLLLNFRANLFLLDWFVNHTTGTDRQLGAFLRQAPAATADRTSG